MVANKHGSHGRRVHTVQIINWSGSKICCNHPWVALLVKNISSLQRIGILCTMCWTWKFKDCQEQPKKGRHPFTINMKAGTRWTIQKTTIEYPWAIPAEWWQEYDEYVPDNSEAGFESIPTSWVFWTCLISRVSECGDAKAVTLYFFAFRPRSLPMNRRPASWDLSKGVQLDAVATTCPTRQRNRYCRNSYYIVIQVHSWGNYIRITWTLFIFSSNTSLPLWFPVFSLRWWMLNDTLHHEPILLRTSKASLGSVWTSWHRAFG